MLNEFDPVKVNLIHYWPFDGNFSDVVSNKKAKPHSAPFSNDHNGKANSSLDLNNGHVSVPNGIYFNGDFTITVWTMLRIITSGSILDFANNQNSNGEISDNIILGFNNSANVYLRIFNGTADSLTIVDSPLILNQWCFISACLENRTTKIYLNGTLVDSKNSSQIPINITRTSNYIGKSNWNNLMTDLKIDELKIYNRALNEAEILKEMGKN